MGAGTAILNGFGISLGDSIIGLQALHAALRLGALDRPVTLFRRTDVRPMVAAIYEFAADLASVRPLTDAADAAPGFRHVIDIRDFAFDPDFRGVAMMDFFLRKLGLEPDAVPAAWRRNAWLAPRIRPVPPAGLPRRYVLVCSRASMPLRDMPEAVHAAILDGLCARQPDPVVTQAAAPGRGGRIFVAPECASVQELCGLVASARLVVSTDTAMVHLADAFGVPCLAFYVTHRPEWRMRDYPLCTPVHLPASGLPPALEFARGAADLEAARRAWFPQGPDLAWIREILDGAVARLT